MKQDFTNRSVDTRVFFSLLFSVHFVKFRANDEIEGKKMHSQKLLIELLKHEAERFNILDIERIV